MIPFAALQASGVPGAFPNGLVTRTRLAQVGTNYGPRHREAVGNQNMVASACGLPLDRVYLTAGQTEGALGAATVEADGAFVSSLPASQSLNQTTAYGGAFACGYATPSAGGRVVTLGVDGSVSLVNPLTGVTTAVSAQASRSHPVGFNASAVNRQNIDLAAGGTTVAVSYCQYNLVRVWTVNSNGAGLTFEQDFTVTAPAGVAIGSDGRPRVIAGVSATFDSAGQVTATSGGSVLVLNANGTTTQAFADGFAPNPWRISINSAGSVAVSSWGPDHRIRVYNSSLVLQGTFGRDGGRLDGDYVATDFNAIGDVEWTNDGTGLWVSELYVPPRRTALIHATTGALVREWYGGQPYQCAVCPEGGDSLTRVWFDTNGGLVRCSFDSTTGAWAILETYTTNLGVVHGLRSVRIGGEVYLYDGVGQFRAYRYDGAGKTLRLVSVIGRTYQTDPFLNSTEQAAVAAAYPGTFYYVWTAPVGGPAVARVTSPLATECVGWKPFGNDDAGTGQNYLHTDGVLWMPQPNRPLKMPSSQRADKALVFAPASLVTLPALTLDGRSYTQFGYLRPSSDGTHYYAVMSSPVGSDGGFNGVWGTWYHKQQSGMAKLVKVLASDDSIVWVGGLKDPSWNRPPGRLGWARAIAGIGQGAVWVLHVADSDVSGVALFDEISGAWMGDAVDYTSPTGGRHPDDVIDRTANGDVLIGSLVVSGGAAYLFSTGLSAAFVDRVDGVVGTVRGPQPVPVSTAAYSSGTGLTLTAYNSADLTGSPGYTSTTANYKRIDDGGSALPGISANPFSFTLSGRFVPTRTETHRFGVYPAGTDIKLWVGGTLVVDLLNGLGRGEGVNGNLSRGRSAPIQLTAGVAVEVLAEVRSATRSAFVGFGGGENRFLCLTVYTPTTDERDIPLAQLLPSGSATALSAGAYNRWQTPTPLTWTWPLTSYSGFRTPGVGVASLCGTGNITVVNDGGNCLEMVSTLNNPAALFLARVPFDADYTPFAPFAVQCDVKTAQNTDDNDGCFGFKRYGYNGGYAALPNIHLLGGDINMRGFGLLLTAVGRADGTWHTLRYEALANGTSRFLVDGVLAASGTRTTFPAPPRITMLAPPTPANNSYTNTWRVRNFSVENF